MPKPSRHTLGDRVGNHVITYKGRPPQGRRCSGSWYVLTCPTCGATIEGGYWTCPDAIQQAAKRTEGCAHCRPVGAALGRVCPQCGDLPWRRPVRRPCRCGEHYAPEPKPDYQTQSATFEGTHQCTLIP